MIVVEIINNGLLHQSGNHFLYVKINKGFYIEDH